MSDFTADLDRLTAGQTVTRFINDDDEFNYVVYEMEDLGHDPDAVIEALTKWIEETPTWDCPNCDLEGVEETEPYCPRCDEANPSVVAEGDDIGLANLAEAVEEN